MTSAKRVVCAQLKFLIWLLFRLPLTIRSLAQTIPYWAQKIPLAETPPAETPRPEYLSVRMFIMDYGCYYRGAMNIDRDDQSWGKTSLEEPIGRP